MAAGEDDRATPPDAPGESAQSAPRAGCRNSKWLTISARCLVEKKGGWVREVQSQHSCHFSSTLARGSACRRCRSDPKVYPAWQPNFSTTLWDTPVSDLWHLWLAAPDKTTGVMESPKIYALVDYEDAYVQPLLVAAIKAQLPPDLLVLIKDIAELPLPTSRVLQWRQYESIDFEHLMQNSASSLVNSYIIRKALIRKHYLSATVSHWLTKHPKSLLKDHVKPSVEFEVDYAEFLDDALLEAYELKESWARNQSLSEDDENREWWILKPGMSDRGQGIRLFSSEEELQQIFEEWDPPSDDEDEDAQSDEQQASGLDEKNGDTSNGIIASQLRHFIAQPYIQSPLLLSDPHPSAGRKFHIRTYVVAFGALKVFVYKPMLALFAEPLYTNPGTATSPNDQLSSHLTNTCLQTGEREGSVHAFFTLPKTVPGVSAQDWQGHVFGQICAITGEVFEAAARSMGIHFQPLPNAFEIFGVDFLVDAQGTAWLLEINAFPDFAQTGNELQALVQDLFQEVVAETARPFFGLPEHEHDDEKSSQLCQVLDIDLGRK